MLLDWPHARRQILSSRRGLFEGLRTDAAEMAVAPGPVIEDFNVIEDIGPGESPGSVYSFLDAFFFSELKNDSATTLSQQLPRRLRLDARLLADRTVASRRCRTGSQREPLNGSPGETKIFPASAH